MNQLNYATGLKNFWKMIYHKKADFKDMSGELKILLKKIKESGDVGVIIHTCNRVELYSGSGMVPEEIARHLFRLISGLESIFIGETFIQGQVKEAYQQASALYKLDASIHRLFQWAFLTGKRVRTETALSRGAMSHSQAVVEIIKEQVFGYQSKRYAFIGINKMNRTIMNFLKGNVHNSFLLCNRSFDKAIELENEFNCKAYKLDHLKTALDQTDIIISGTSAPHAIIRREHIPSNHPLLIFDLSIPSDVDMEVQGLSGIQYYGLKQIEQQVNGNKEIRFEEVQKAEMIIEDEVKRFLEYQKRYFYYKQFNINLETVNTIWNR